MKNDWEILLRILLNEEINLEAISDFLRTAIDDGINEIEIAEYLEKLRTTTTVDEKINDRILEVLDIVTGWCQSKFRIRL